MKTASKRNSSMNMTYKESKHCAETVTNIATSYIKSSSSGNNKPFARKRGRQKYGNQCYPSRTKSVFTDWNRMQFIMENQNSSIC